MFYWWGNASGAAAKKERGTRWFRRRDRPGGENNRGRFFLGKIEKIGRRPGAGEGEEIKLKRRQEKRLLRNSCELSWTAHWNVGRSKDLLIQGIASEKAKKKVWKRFPRDRLESGQQRWSDGQIRQTGRPLLPHQGGKNKRRRTKFHYPVSVTFDREFTSPSHRRGNHTRGTQAEYWNQEIEGKSQSSGTLKKKAHRGWCANLFRWPHGGIWRNFNQEREERGT